MTKLVLVLVLHLIVWDDGARYMDQSQRDVKQKTKAFQDHFRNSIENCSTLDHYGDDWLETRQIVLVIVRANRRKWVNCQGVPNIYIYIYIYVYVYIYICIYRYIYIYAEAPFFILAFCRLSYPDISINYAWMYAHVHKMYKTLSTFICSRDVNEMELFNYLLWL